MYQYAPCGAPDARKLGPLCSALKVKERMEADPKIFLNEARKAVKEGNFEVAIEKYEPQILSIYKIFTR